MKQQIPDTSFLALLPDNIAGSTIQLLPDQTGSDGTEVPHRKSVNLDVQEVKLLRYQTTTKNIEKKQKEQDREICGSLTI